MEEEIINESFTKEELDYINEPFNKKDLDYIKKTQKTFNVEYYIIKK